MNYIIYDLEFTVLRNQQHLSELIEIGAVRIEESEGQLVMTDIFHSYVKPSRNPILSPLTIEFTGITQDKINQAHTFPFVSRDFMNWLGEKEYYLCSWGPDDKFQLIRHCRSHGLSVDWIRNYNDLQHPFSMKYGKGIFQQIGLKKALEMLNIPFLGNPHNALDDAFNTAKVFKRIFDQLQLEKNVADEEVYATRLVYKSGHETNNPFEQLAQLLGMEGVQFNQMRNLPGVG